IRDLPKKGLNIDIKNHFKPTYEVSIDKKKIVSELKRASKNKEVYLASDEDREGEAIAWHLTKVLDLEPKNSKRIVFHEITKPAIEQAIKNPRPIDKKLFDAQQARRVLDRLVGYELSPVLWKKVKGGLSAGRVQSVAVRIIVDREREIKEHKPKVDFKVTAKFVKSKDIIDAELNKRLTDVKSSEKWLNDIKNAKFTISDITQNPAKRNPSAPFTTSTLQQEASRKLGYSVRQTMSVAQKLYETGHITYMRTDSTILSNTAISSAEKYINEKFGQKYHQVRQYKTKSQTAQEAHEAIRPTNLRVSELKKLDVQQDKLYKLIWQRTLASQMSPAEIENTTVQIKISNKDELFNAKGQVLIFDGFLKVYGKQKDDTILPPLEVNDNLKLKSALAVESFSRASARYSEAALVKKLEELNIGRPSTYAPTISTIQTRGYVEKTDIEGKERIIKEVLLENNKVRVAETTLITGSDSSKLVPTATADIVTDFLVKYFPSIVDYDFTAKVEKDFDEIAQGKQQWDEMIADFYKNFHPLITKSDKVSRKEVSKARTLGKDPATKLPISARFGRYGPMLVKGDTEDKESKPVFAPLPEGTTLEDVTLEQALDMFTLPRLVGKTKDGKDIMANIGRFGPYIHIDKVFVSIKPLNPHNISLKKAIELYDQRIKKLAARNIKEFDSGIKIINGPYGPYITDGKKNVKIEDKIKPATITEDQ
ncbi:MAG TPA: type I DNA topoisomerase, partial [Patescibacteria group bacterium]|nr:type I DNA topoisomerase [Patescibacteria group bacterium]